jgi:hypothetical protein
MVLCLDLKFNYKVLRFKVDGVTRFRVIWFRVYKVIGHEMKHGNLGQQGLEPLKKSATG